MLIRGIILGLIYSLPAVGFTIIFGVYNVLHCAYGALYMVAAYLAFTYFVTLGLPYYGALVVTILTTAVLNLVIMYLVIYNFRKDVEKVLLMTFCIAIIFEEACTIIYGPVWKNLPCFIEGSIEIFGVTESLHVWLICLCAIIAFAITMLLLNKTKTGKSLYVISWSESLGSMYGISVRRSVIYVSLLTGMLAALSSIFITPLYLVSPSMGWRPLIFSFMAVCLGGTGSLFGAMFASIILGLAETFVASYMPAFSTSVGLIIIVVILLIKPKGLFGK